MPESTAVLLRSLVDYAGLFPPAALDLDDAVSVYARAAAGPHAAMLGRFVVPASRLDQLGGRLPILAGPGRPRWPLAVLMSGEPGEAQRVARFRAAHQGMCSVDALEFGPMGHDRIAATAVALADSAGGTADVFFECPIDSALETSVEIIGRHRAMAKVRTGGTAASAFPSAPDLVRFIFACRDTGIAFKATAGLHHAWAGRYPLTYDRGVLVPGCSVF